jgi:hypothetical protein
MTERFQTQASKFRARRHVIQGEEPSCSGRLSTTPSDDVGWRAVCLLVETYDEGWTDPRALVENGYG